ncbi:hypothetical protein L6164_035832 [Bauhinia variegata]|uniref:Uncharacterized protein n=1 Tax=Bauhinia variegata TaxID=167791 RepID=A0ACB9KF90_BAUVA|nr:hypothetical protein L6164_035832 [Bauhinia variegata]
MEVQSVCRGRASLTCGSSKHPLSLVPCQIATRNQGGLGYQRYRIENISKCLKWQMKEFSLLSLKRMHVIHATNTTGDGGLEARGDQISSVSVTTYAGVEQFRGKSGSVSFHGLTHHLVEEGKLMSAPFQEEKGSHLWLLAPVSFISCFLLPQFFIGNVIEAFFMDEILVDFLTSLFSEALFYVGLAAFLCVTDLVQRPYLEYSTKRWGLITGLRGYLASVILTTGLKVVAPFFLLSVTLPVVGLAAPVAVTPFLVGCLAQYAFEKYLDKRESSCWPLVPIIFEVYRLYQLTRAVHFVQKLMYSMKGHPTTPELIARTGALSTMTVTFQVLGIVCLWSLMTFLLRLFPSRPVAEKY